MDIIDFNKSYTPGRKLLTGLIRFPIGIYMCYFVGVNGMTAGKKYLFSILAQTLNLPTGLSTIISLIAFLIVSFLSAKYFLVGGLQILSFRQCVSFMGDTIDPAYSDREISERDRGAFPNITRALRMRESMMSGMNDAEAASFYRDTSKVDQILGGGKSTGKNTKRALGYMESRMAGMNDRKAVDYLRGKK